MGWMRFRWILLLMEIFIGTFDRCISLLSCDWFKLRPQKRKFILGIEYGFGINSNIIWKILLRIAVLTKNRSSNYTASYKV